MYSEEFNYPEISFNMNKFECLGHTFYIIIESSQIPVMTEFFKTLETTNLNWEQAKEICMNELLNIELPNYQKLPEKMSQNFYKSSRSIYAFQQMESSPKVQDFILQLSRDRKLNKILKNDHKASEPKTH
jgi:hypothetical protein